MAAVSFSDDDREPLEFELGGQTFHPFISLLDLRRRREIFDLTDNTVEGAVAVLDLFEVMLGDEYPDFERVVNRCRVRPKRLLEIFYWVLGQEFGGAEDPTSPQTGAPGPDGASADGLSSTGRTSPAGSSLDLGQFRTAAELALAGSPERLAAARGALDVVERALTGQPPG